MVPGYYWIEVVTENQSGDGTNTIPTPKLPGGSCRVHAMLLEVNHSDEQQSFAADCYISRYVSGGVELDGHWYALSGEDITEAFCTVSVNGCLARGGFLIELF